MAKYLAGVDVGTTGVRCAIFDLAGRMIAGEHREYGATYPKPGWVEQDSGELIDQTFAACKAAVEASGVDPAEIASAGFSTQRSVTNPVDAAGRPVRPVLSWQDARTAAEVAQMSGQIDPARYHEISGMPMGATWIITKILWMRGNEPDLYAKTDRFVQTQDVVLKAFGADEFYTDIPDMAFYGVWDVRKLEFSAELMDLFAVRAEQFGKPAPAGTQVGVLPPEVARKTGFAPGMPICLGAGDQNCSMVGMGAIEAGMAGVTLGTAGVAILCMDAPPAGLDSMMITNHARAGMWQAEGLANAAASCYRWFRDNLTGEAGTYEQLNEQAAAAPPGSRGVLYLPYLATACTPRWNANARAAFIGMSFAHGLNEMVRAVMEGVALEVRDMMGPWLSAGLDVDVLRLSGGATRSPLWNQIQADVYNRPVQTLECNESTVLGAALLGGLGAGVFSSIEEGTDAMVHVAEEIEPNPDNRAIYEEMYEAYVKAYAALADGGAFDKLADIQSRS
ncbi:MAG: carbohydrate kinase [Phycisphaerae bacterium]|nr:carbohydrate kinase [Phycisphaerae bacterium]